MSDTERRDGQGEDERALRDFVKRLSYQRLRGEMSEDDRDNADYEGGYDNIVQEARALRFRLAEPAQAEEYVCEHCGQRFTSLQEFDEHQFNNRACPERLIKQPEPAQAAPSEIDIALAWADGRLVDMTGDKARRLLAAEVRHLRAALASYERQFADMTANEVKLSAALASERAKTCAACGDPLGEVAYCDVCAEEVRNPALLAKRFPAPDAAAPRGGLENAIQLICQLCRRLNPQHKNCNSCEEVDQLRALLRSEPRGEEGRG